MMMMMREEDSDDDMEYTEDAIDNMILELSRDGSSLWLVKIPKPGVCLACVFVCLFEKL